MAYCRVSRLLQGEPLAYRTPNKYISCLLVLGDPLGYPVNQDITWLCLADVLYSLCYGLAVKRSPELNLCLLKEHPTRFFQAVPVWCKVTFLREQVGMCSGKALPGFLYVRKSKCTLKKIERDTI